MPAIIRSGDCDLALELIRKHPHLLHARFSGNLTPLLIATYSRQPDIAAALWDVGADMDFMAAVALGNSDAVRNMLDDNPNFIHKHTPNNGWTALHVGAGYADTETVRLLISAGADVNSRETKRFTPLFYATDEPYAKAEILLVNGADVNARGKQGLTVLHCAAAAGNAGFVRFLTDHGANPNLQTEARQTPWALAVRYRRREVTALLDSR